MPRPDFTKEEEILIAQIRRLDKSRREVLLSYVLWGMVSIVIFLLGLFREVQYFTLGGFAMIFYPFCRMALYQTKRGWLIRGIIEKYEGELTGTT